MSTATAPLVLEAARSRFAADPFTKHAKAYAAHKPAIIREAGLAAWAVLDTLIEESHGWTARGDTTPPLSLSDLQERTSLRRNTISDALHSLERLRIIAIEAAAPKAARAFTLLYPTEWTLDAEPAQPEQSEPSVSKSDTDEKVAQAPSVSLSVTEPISPSVTDAPNLYRQAPQIAPRSDKKETQRKETGERKSLARASAEHLPVPAISEPSPPATIAALSAKRVAATQGELAPEYLEVLKALRLARDWRDIPFEDEVLMLQGLIEIRRFHSEWLRDRATDFVHKRDRAHTPETFHKWVTHDNWRKHHEKWLADRLETERSIRRKLAAQARPDDGLTSNQRNEQQGHAILVAAGLSKWNPIPPEGWRPPPSLLRQRQNPRGASVESSDEPDAIAHCHALASRYVSSRTHPPARQP